MDLPWMSRDEALASLKARSDACSIPAEVWANSPSLTVQSQAEDADLNVLMRRFGITGKLPENPRVPTYGDFSHITDYRSAIEMVRAADVEFAKIPAEIRSKFDNDPQRLLEFVHNPANRAGVKEIFGERTVSSVSGGAVAASVGAAASGAAGDGGAAGGGAVGGKPAA